MLELCGGDLLTAVQDLGGSLDDAHARAYFRDAASGLAHCHTAGVFHLDVKPDNLLVRQGRVKVADFGCAIVAAAPAASAPCASASSRAALAVASPSVPWFFSPAQRGASATAAVPHYTTHKCGTTVYAAPEALRCRDLGRQHSRADSSAGHSATAVPLRRGNSGVCAAALRLCIDRPVLKQGAALEVPTAYDAGKADVWSLGVSMVVCTTGFFPWESARLSDERYTVWSSSWSAWDKAVVSGRKTPADAAASLGRLLCDLSLGSSRGSDSGMCEAMLSLVVGMLTPDASRRLSMAEVLDHAWMQCHGAGSLAAESLECESECDMSRSNSMDGSCSDMSCVSSCGSVTITSPCGASVGKADSVASDDVISIRYARSDIDSLT